MKDDLPYFTHDNNASQHPKMKALIAEYGFEGYGRFWALNEKIAQTPNAYIDISRKVYKLDLANELRLNSDELDKFLAFLSDPEIDLINLKNKKISTDRIDELHKKIIEKRKNRRKNNQDDENGKMDEHFDEMSEQNGKMDEHFDIEEKRIDKNREEENKTNTGDSTEPPVSENPYKVIGDKVIDMTEPINLATCLLSSHQKEFPDFLSGKTDKEIKKKIDGWAVDIEKLIRIDKKSPEIIKQVILWVKTPNNFWFQNIESGKKLREKFERLYGQMVTEQKKTSPPRHKIAADNITDVRKYFKEAT
jgi:hypothetical protein